MTDALERLRTALAGRYAVERELGAGGMAVVYLARDVKHDRPVALKVLRRELAAEIGPGRFLREIGTAARLTHPHILPLHDSGEADGFLYYVMPYVEGESLRARITQEKQLPLEDALRIAREVAGALSHAHRQGVVHRDIKPENILLQGGHAVVADFGIALAIAAVEPNARTATMTAAGAAVGTPAYMSPEQAAGSRDVDGRSDLYSLGCVLYEMLAGQPPFTGPTVQSLVHQHLNVTPRPVTELRPAVPGWVGQALQRALAKTAADRWETAERFGEALGAATATPAPGSPAGSGGPMATTAAGKPAPARRRRALVGVGVVVLLAAGAFVAWKTGVFPDLTGRSAPAAKKEWILVAEFEGPPGDSTLAVATRDVVSAALDQSGILAVVTRGQIAEALNLAGKPATTRVDAALARELAYRSAVRAVVEGRVSRLGPGYAIVLRVMDVERDSLVLSVSDVADGERAIIPTVEGVVRRVREGLGERRSAIRASRPTVQVMTPSFDAFKHQRRAVELVGAGDSRGAIETSRKALALDPDFAAAFFSMGTAFNNIGHVDSALAAFREALGRPSRLNDRARLLGEAMMVALEGNLPAAVAIYDRVLEQDPSAVAAYINRGFLLYTVHQYEAALVTLEGGVAASPFPPNQILLTNQFLTFLALGRLDDSRAVARSFRGELARSAPVWNALASGNWTQVESLGTALEANPAASSEMLRLGALAVAAGASARGAVGRAEQAIRRAEGITARSVPAAHLSTHAARRARLLLGLVTPGSGSALEPTRIDDTTATGLVTGGLDAAAAGNTKLARRLLSRLQSRPARERTSEGAAPALLEAWISAREGRWQETIHTLGPAARAGSEPGLKEDGAGRVMMRWLMAEAHERLGSPDSAAAYLELVLSPLGRVDQEYLTRGIAFSFAHQRLVLLYVRLGRLEDARRHWEILQRTFTSPDPEMVPMIEEARAALESAEAMAAGQRR